MSLRIDIHVHTRLHSPCSRIEPEALIRQAAKIGLDGLVITEHQYQWSPHDVAALVERSGARNFLVLTGFEYTSLQGDLLIYGLSVPQAGQFRPGLTPEEAVHMAHDMGGICVAAHPTRATMGFDERIATLALDAIEIRSMNLQEHEQRLAATLAAAINVLPVAASDAHDLAHVGRYVTEFDDPIQTMADLHESFRRGRFRPGDNAPTRMMPL
jgi:hypothetical protein